MLLEKANVQGYLTTDDLIEIYPDVSKDSERLETIMLALRRRGVDILDQEIDLPEEETQPASDLNPYADLTPIASDDTIGLYLKEMARVALLTVEEEIHLARCIEAGRAAKAMLDRSNGSLAADQRRELEFTFEEGVQARVHLIKANTRLVVSIAKRYVGRGVPFLDLIQEGNLGLMKAVEKYEYQRGFRFSTYATWWIRQ
ncbi:MAG: sigma-70 family RNA polymerase sigma factor, partial [Anaerolineaceae bacterium]